MDILRPNSAQCMNQNFESCFVFVSLIVHPNGYQINAIVESLPRERQTLLFSATQTNNVKQLARVCTKVRIPLRRKLIFVFSISEIYSGPSDGVSA